MTIKEILQTLFVVGTIGYFGFETGRSYAFGNAQREAGLVAMKLEQEALNRVNIIRTSTNVNANVLLSEARAYDSSSQEVSKLVETFRRR